MVMETNRLILRKCTVDDVEALEPILGDAEVMRYSLRGPCDREGIEEYLRKILAHYEEYGYGLWAVILKETDRLIGLTGLIRQIVDGISFVELGYRFAKPYWGRGFAGEATIAVKEYAFTTLTIDLLVSIIEPDNVRSIEVAKRNGMRRMKSTLYHGKPVDIYSVEKIILCPYNPIWNEIYAEEFRLLKGIFQDHRIVFHHIGSTSIPGCDAKPIIDILGITNNALEIDPFNKALEEIGYVPMGEYGMRQRRFFLKRDSSKANLHIFEDSDPESARHLRFRDYLRSHPEKIREYSELKKRNSLKNSTDIIEYILGKESFVKEVDYRAAMEDSGRYWNQELFPRKSSWTCEELIAAMEVNMQLHMIYFSKYLPNQKFIFEPEGIVVKSDIPDDTFNYAIGARYLPKEQPERVSHVVNLFKKENFPFSWWIREQELTDSLREEFEKQGLSFKEQNIGMSLSLDKREFSFRDLSVQRVLTDKALQDFAMIMTSIGVYPDIYEQFFHKIPPVLYGEGSAYEMYVGYLEEKPVVTGILVLHANVAGLYYIIAKPECRKKGYATQIMNFLLKIAFEKGYHMAVLQASEEGIGLYEKLGFEQKCRFLEYAWSP